MPKCSSERRKLSKLKQISSFLYGLRAKTLSLSAIGITGITYAATTYATDCVSN